MSIRLTYLLGFVVVCLLLLCSLYLQLVEGVLPCPLCSLQRITFCFLGIIFLLGILCAYFRFGRFISNTLIAFTSMTGIMLAGRQIWLQHYPSAGSNECGVSLQYMMQALPVNEVFQKIIFEGGAECKQRGWEFLHLNMAEWALFWFIVTFLLSIYLFIQEFREK